MKNFQLIDLSKRIIFAIQKFEKVLKMDLVGPIDLIESSHDIESIELDIDNLEKALEIVETKKSFSCEDILKSVVAFHVGLVRISVMIRDLHNIVSLASREIIEKQNKAMPLRNKKIEGKKKK